MSSSGGLMTVSVNPTHGKPQVCFACKRGLDDNQITFITHHGFPHYRYAIHPWCGICSHCGREAHPSDLKVRSNGMILCNNHDYPQSVQPTFLGVCPSCSNVMNSNQRLATNPAGFQLHAACFEGMGNQWQYTNHSLVQPAIQQSYNVQNHCPQIYGDNSQSSFYQANRDCQLPMNSSVQYTQLSNIGSQAVQNHQSLAFYQFGTNQQEQYLNGQQLGNSRPQYYPYHHSDHSQGSLHHISSSAPQPNFPTMSVAPNMVHSNQVQQQPDNFIGPSTALPNQGPDSIHPPQVNIVQQPSYSQDSKSGTIGAGSFPETSCETEKWTHEYSISSHQSQRPDPETLNNDQMSMREPRGGSAEFEDIRENYDEPEQVAIITSSISKKEFGDLLSLENGEFDDLNLSSIAPSVLTGSDQEIGSDETFRTDGTLSKELITEVLGEQSSGGRDNPIIDYQMNSVSSIDDKHSIQNYERKSVLEITENEASSNEASAMFEGSLTDGLEFYISQAKTDDIPQESIIITREGKTEVVPLLVVEISDYINRKDVTIEPVTFHIQTDPSYQERPNYKRKNSQDSSLNPKREKLENIDQLRKPILLSEEV